jgi:hypothetical protein
LARISKSKKTFFIEELGEFYDNVWKYKDKLNSPKTGFWHRLENLCHQVFCSLANYSGLSYRKAGGAAPSRPKVRAA